VHGDAEAGHGRAQPGVPRGTDRGADKPENGPAQAGRRLVVRGVHPPGHGSGLGHQPVRDRDTGQSKSPWYRSTAPVPARRRSRSRAMTFGCPATHTTGSSPPSRSATASSTRGFSHTSTAACRANSGRRRSRGVRWTGSPASAAKASRRAAGPQPRAPSARQVVETESLATPYRSQSSRRAAAPAGGSQSAWSASARSASCATTAPSSRPWALPVTRAASSGREAAPRRA
jgi:hypothetical protein